MEFDDTIRIKESSVRLKAGGAVIKNIINLYKTPPFGQLTLEECQDLFKQRIEALSIIESADFSTNQKAQLVANSLKNIKSHVYKTNCISLRARDLEQRKQDHFSHMLVRMYCIGYHDNNLWNWFRTCERKLLYYRLRDFSGGMSGSHFEAILEAFDFNFKRVLGAEFKELEREKLIGWEKLRPDGEQVDIFRVRFIDAIKFIGWRSVSLKDGYAFLNKHEIMSVVCDVFEKHLDNELKYGLQHLNTELLQARQLLDSLRIVYLDHIERIEDEKRSKLNSSAPRNPYTIDINNLNEISKNHYPPCMRYMHDALLEDHHLKHSARVYYGAFLRTGGVDMESAIEFWRREFTKKIPNDKFERDYKYNIRHLYGREGHKKALSCFSCDKIINDNPPGPSEKHGCPFKHFDETHLKTMLAKHDLKSVDVDSVLKFTNEKEYKLACSHYFKFVKGELPTEPIKNPIHYYYESMRLANRPAPELKQEVEFEEMDAEMINSIKVLNAEDVNETRG